MMSDKDSNENLRRGLIPAVFFIALILAVCLSPQFRAVYALPLNIRVIEDENALFKTKFPFTLSLKQNEESIQDDFLSSLPIISSSKPAFSEPLKTGQTTLNFKIFGIIPFRTVQVDVLPSVKLVPGGHSIGVMLHSNGIMVVGNSPVLSTEGRYLIPAKEAGILVGDILLSINGIPLQNDKQVAEIIDESGKNGRIVNILLKRDEGQQNINITPVLCSDTKRYRIGLYVRDSAAGVGTLTFYEPDSGVYGALGHIITDNDTNQPIDCEQGKIVLATVSGIQHGKRGHPGEKLGIFIDEEKMLGDINKNTQFGIYGRLTNKPFNDSAPYAEALPVASMSQVMLGKAQMLTVVEGQIIEKFDIEIEKINLQESPESKGLVLKVTDQRLLNKTGGIVQGMSGSPIIQNGKIVGAVTHVFVHDPTLGYGCFMDWMLMDSGIIHKNENFSKKLFGILDKNSRGFRQNSESREFFVFI